MTESSDDGASNPLDEDAEVMCGFRIRAEQLVSELERALEAEHLDTEALGHFWQDFTEQALLRLVRLKPEMVRHPPFGTSSEDNV